MMKTMICDIKTARVGVMDSIKTKDGYTLKTMSLYEALTTDVYKEKVQRLRNLTDETRQKALKTKIPVFYGSGYFDVEGVFRHNGFVLLDIDAQDNENICNLTSLPKILSRALENGTPLLPYVSMCIRSCRGKGLVMAIPIAEPKRHKEHYKVLASMFEKAGLKVDLACFNANRKRYFSYDEAPYYNPNAIVFDGIIGGDTNVNSKHKKDSFRSNATIEDLKRVEAVYDALKARGLEYCPKYEDYQELALIFAPSLGEDGREMYHSICSLSCNYDEADANKKYDDALRNGRGNITLGTFFHKANEILRIHSVEEDFGDIINF